MKKGERGDKDREEKGKCGWCLVESEGRRRETERGKIKKAKEEERGWKRGECT